MHIQFDCIASQASVTADRNYLKMALNNVIQNAINYGDGRVNIQLKERENSAIISISDNGKGISPDMREQIVKPFIRGASTGAKYKGHGVGLAIVKRVLDWHNGTLNIGESSELSGAKFTLVVPFKE